MADEKRDVSSESDKAVAGHAEIVDGARDIAERGHAATDQFGNSLIELDPKAEAKLRNKLDLFLVPTVSLLYLFCFIDRANIGNARIAGLEKDLGLKGYDYNALLSIFYISYVVFEIPSNILCKWLGPGWVLPALSLGFGIASVAMGFVHNFAQGAGVRFILGMFEAGLMPGIAYYLSRWYRRAELTFRLSLYIVMAPMAGAFGGLLASGILTLDHVGGVKGWRMIFVVEGIITIGLSIISFFTLTDRPETARWLTAEERELAIARIKSERVATTEVLDKMDKKKLLSGILNPITLSTSIVYMLNNITVQGLAFFAPTIVRTIYPEKSTVIQQLYTVPPYVVGGFFTVFLPLLSWRWDRRQIILIISTPLVITGYSMFLGTTNSSARYAATFLLSSSLFAVGPLANSQVSANVVSDTARSSAIGLNVMMGNIGGLVSTWSYLPNDGPNYPIGNGLNLACCCTVLIVATLTLLWMKADNKKRDGRNPEEELAGMSQQEVQDLDWKHPAFRWKP